MGGFGNGWFLDPFGSDEVDSTSLPCGIELLLCLYLLEDGGNLSASPGDDLRCEAYTTSCFSISSSLCANRSLLLEVRESG